MLYLLFALTFVATYTRPPRCPQDVLQSDLKDWVKIVWLAVRQVQGVNDTAWAGREHYAEICGKDPTQISAAWKILKAGGWLGEVGRNGRTPVLQCYVPGTVWADPRAGSEDAGKVNPAHREGEPSSPSKVNPVHPEVNPAHREGEPSSSSPYKEESGKGIRTRNPEENNNNTRTREREGGERPPVLTAPQADVRRRLLALGVFDVPADRIVRTMEPAWVVQVLRAGEHLQRRGKTAGLGAVVVAIADGKQPLPAIDPPVAAPRPVVPPPAVEPEPTDEERAAGLAYAERAGLSVRAA